MDFKNAVYEAQEVELVVCLSEGQCFYLWLLQSARQSVLGQDTETQIAPDGSSSGICVSVYVSLMSEWYFVLTPRIGQMCV